MSGLPPTVWGTLLSGDGDIGSSRTVLLMTQSNIPRSERRDFGLLISTGVLLEPALLHEI